MTIIAAGRDAVRFRAALEIAAAQVALGRPARLFLQGEAVAMLGRGPAAADDALYLAAGLPTLAQLLDEALALGVECIACQTGLTLAQLSAETLPAGVAVGGLVSMLADAGDDQLLMA